MKTIKSNSITILIITVTLLIPCYLCVGQANNYCSQYIRAWGVAKYYSPFQTNSLPNLDSVFIQDIKNVISKNDKKALNVAVSNLLIYIKTKVEATEIYESDPLRIACIDSINRWVNGSPYLSKNNKSELTQLTHRQRNASNIFVKNDPENASAVFINEKRFLSPFPQAEIRLLTFARYWNAVNFFYPHKSLIKVDWVNILDVFVYELLTCKSELEYHLTISKLTTIINDGHGTIYSYPLEKNYGFYQLPCQVSFIDNKLFITDILNTTLNNPFKFGDIIVDIDHQSFYEYYLKDSCYLWGNNVKRKKNNCAKNFLKSQDNKKKLIKFIRNDTLMEVFCPYVEVSSLNNNNLLNYKNSAGIIIGENYLYLNLNKIDSFDFEKIVLSIQKPNIIIDLREYPNWVLNQIADLFAPNELPFAAYRCPDISTPGLFNPPQLLFLKPKKIFNRVHYDQLILMVDYTTISRGEFLCMAFQSLPHVVTIGDYTAGADGDITKILLPGNISTQFTGLDILYPDGEQTQQYGIKIDKIFVEKGIGISIGEDEELAYIINSVIKP